MRRRSILLALMFTLILVRLQGGAAPPVAPEPAGKEALYAPAEQAGTIVDRQIAEASGLAASRRDDNLLWVINDSGNPPVLFAIAADGRTRAKFTVADTANDDWEDLASFTLDQIHYLLIADTGDNMAGRTHCVLYVVEEPEVKAGPQMREESVPVKWQIRFAYPDGPRDCEAAAVDVRRKRVLLLSKCARPPVLYEVPLMPSPGQVTAEVIGPVTSIPPPTPEDIKQPYGFSWSRPTAMDLSTDGSRLVILTYKHAYAFVKSPEQSWRSAISAPGVTVLLPHPGIGLPIREGLCIQPSTGDLFVTGESLPAPVFRLQPLAAP